MLSEYKRRFQHRLRSKCYKYIFLNLSPKKKNQEVIPFILIPESIERAHNKRKKIRDRMLFKCTMWKMHLSQKNQHFLNVISSFQNVSLEVSMVFNIAERANFIGYSNSNIHFYPIRCRVLPAIWLT